MRDFHFDDADVAVHYMRIGESIPLTLRNIRAAHPNLFHRNQDWFEPEKFMDRVADTIPDDFTVETWTKPYLFPKQDSQRVSASSLAWCYIRNPNLSVWDRYIWCDDLDSQGQRVYVGGRSNTGRFEIHRHLTISSRFGLPKW